MSPVSNDITFKVLLCIVEKQGRTPKKNSGAGGSELVQLIWAGLMGVAYAYPKQRQTSVDSSDF